MEDSIHALIAAHERLLKSNSYCYFELAYTRTTDWMAWITTKPLADDPDRKVLACGQDITPGGACLRALTILRREGLA